MYSLRTLVLTTLLITATLPYGGCNYPGEGPVVSPGPIVGYPAKHQGPVFDIDVDEQGLFAASAGADHTVRIWDIAHGAEIGNDVVTAITAQPSVTVPSARFTDTPATDNP